MTNNAILIRGQVYTVTESCQMILLEGIYLGRLSRGNNFECFVFKSTSPHWGSKYFGANWRLSESSSEKPTVYLYNTHYGDSPEKLKSIAEQSTREIKLDFVE